MINSFDSDSDRHLIKRRKAAFCRRRKLSRAKGERELYGFAQRELANIENYNTSLHLFLNIIIANYLGFKPMPFFEARDEDREVPMVEF